MKLYLSMLVACGIIATVHVTASAKIVIPAAITVDTLLKNLSLDDMLTLVGIGKIKALVERPDIAEKLSALQAEIDTTFEQMYGDLIAQHAISVEQRDDLELQFKQKMTLAFYRIVYAEVQKQLAEKGTDAQKSIFAVQLPPDTLTALF